VEVEDEGFVGKIGDGGKDGFEGKRRGINCDIFFLWFPFLYILTS
jgi:hypothetical protein